MCCNVTVLNFILTDTCSLIKNDVDKTIAVKHISIHKEHNLNEIYLDLQKYNRYCECIFICFRVRAVYGVTSDGANG